MTLFNNDIQYGSYRTDPRVLAQAHEIGSRGRLNGRTREEKMHHALDGSALEMAVRQELGVIGAREGWDILEPLDKTHDLRLKRRDGKIFKIDVKGRFSFGSKTLTVSQWEADNADPDTVYLVFECDDEEAEFIGWFTSFDLEDGRYGPFVWLSNLSRENPFA
jgi:hypothetical protein